MDIDKKTIKNKDDVLQALRLTKGIVTQACKNANVNRSTFYRWCSEDEDFAKGYKDVLEEQKDFVEGCLLDNIEAGKETSIIFYLKSKAKDRGYVEKQEIEHSGSTSVDLSLMDTDEITKRFQASKAIEDSEKNLKKITHH